jgi:hypothetical protein
VNSASKTALYKAQDLWHHIFGDERGLLAICCASEASSKFSTQFFNYPDSADPAAEWALEKTRAEDVYFCTHLLSSARRVKENATVVHTLWGDLDGTEVPEGELAPTAVIGSSPDNFHCYWRLADAIPPEVAEGLNKRLAAAIGADESGFDLTQLLRMPGTVNHKYEEKPVVEIIKLEHDHTYTAGELDRILPQPEAPDFGTAADVDAQISDGTRNKTLTSLAGTLRRRGLDEEGMFAALVGLNAKKCNPPLPETEVAQIAHSVARYEPVQTFELERNGRDAHAHAHIDTCVRATHNPKKNLRAISFAGREMPPPQKFVVEGILPCGLSTSFYGGGGLAKSVNVLHLGMSVAFTSVDYWHDLRIETTPVIYLDFEMAEGVQLRRAKEIANGAGWPDVPKNFHYVEAAGHPTMDVFAFALELVEKYGPALVIVDSFGYSMEGESERSADVLSYVRGYLTPLQEMGSTPLVVDHISRAIKGERTADKEAFGSVYKTNSMRSTVNVTGHADEDTGVVYATFTHRKSNVSRKLPPFTVMTQFSQDAIKFERSDEVIQPPTEETVEQAVVAAIRENGPMTNHEIADVAGRQYGTIRNATGKLKRSGTLVETGEKRNREVVLNLPESEN